MGDTYFIQKLNCAYCEKENNFVKEKEMFSEMGLLFQFDFDIDFICQFCKKKNVVIQEFKTVKSKKGE